MQLLLRLLTLLLRQPRLLTLPRRLLTRLVPLLAPLLMLPRRQPSDLLIHSENGKGVAQAAPFLFVLSVTVAASHRNTAAPGQD